MNYREIANQIELKVEQTRELVKHKWFYPTVEQSYLWMWSELGEFAETEVVDEANWTRNNSPKQYDSREKELAQFVIMLATVNIQTKKGERSPTGSASERTSWVINHILFGKNDDSISEDLLLRAVRFINIKNLGIDLLKAVDDECNRLVAKYTANDTDGAKPKSSRSRNASQLSATDSAI